MAETRTDPFTTADLSSETEKLFPSAGGFERESRNFLFNNLLKGMLAGYWEWDLSQNHFFASPSLKSLMGLPKRQSVELINRCPEFILAEDGRKWRSMATTLMSSRRTDSLEQGDFRCRHSDGRVLHLRLRMCVLERDTMGPPLRLGGCFMDVTDAVQSQPAEDAPEKRSRSQEAVEEARYYNRAEFISAISHELRTPLMSIVGTTHLLIEENPRSDQKEHLDALSFASSTLLSVVNDILDFGKLEIGSLAFEKVEFSPESIAQSVLESFNYKRKEKNIELLLKMEPGLPASLLGDASRLSQILFNVVGNAIKFTREGKVVLHVRAGETSEKEQKIRFIVEDTGIGIPEWHLDKIFEPFSELSTTTGRTFGGTGLGLAITKKLVQLQKGTIRCESAVGRGTTMVIEIPYGRIANEASAPPKGGAFEYPLLAGRILVAEDNAVIAKITCKFLEKWGIETSLVSGGEKALEAVINGDFDLVLMDLQMPGMDGYETALRIRHLADRRKARTPIVCITAAAQDEVKKRLFAVGMDDYLIKPVNPHRMYEKVARYLPVAAEVERA